MIGNPNVSLSELVFVLLSNYNGHMSWLSLWLPEGPTPHLLACFQEALFLSLLLGFPLSL